MYVPKISCECRCHSAKKKETTQIQGVSAENYTFIPSVATSFGVPFPGMCKHQLSLIENRGILPTVCGKKPDAWLA